MRSFFLFYSWLLETLQRELTKEYNDEANLEKTGWGVPVLLAWKDKTDTEVVAHLRELAEKEREMKRF